MDLTLPAPAVELARSAERALLDAGGVDLARTAEADRTVRTARVEPLIAGLGLDGADLLGDLDALAAAGEVCRIAGRLAIPYPVAGRLAAGLDPEERALAVVDADSPWIDHADLLGPWRAIDLDGATHAAVPGDATTRKLAPFARAVTLTAEPAHLDPRAAPLVLCLEASRILGAVEAAQQLAARHVTEREQFGQPLARFQSVQFKVVDCVVEVRGLRQLAHFTLWRLLAAPEDAWVDALALRMGALEAANLVLNTAHQLVGALGFCDEHDLSVIDRHIQSALRLPTSLARTTDLFGAAVDTQGFASLFDPRASRAPVQE